MRKRKDNKMEVVVEEEEDSSMREMEVFENIKTGGRIPVDRSDLTYIRSDKITSGSVEVNVWFKFDKTQKTTSILFSKNGIIIAVPNKAWLTEKRKASIYKHLEKIKRSLLRKWVDIFYSFNSPYNLPEEDEEIDASIDLSTLPRKVDAMNEDNDGEEEDLGYDTDEEEGRIDFDYSIKERKAHEEKLKQLAIEMVDEKEIQRRLQEFYTHKPIQQQLAVQPKNITSSYSMGLNPLPAKLWAIIMDKIQKRDLKSKQALAMTSTEAKNVFLRDIKSQRIDMMNQAMDNFLEEILLTNVSYFSQELTAENMDILLRTLQPEGPWTQNNLRRSLVDRMIKTLEETLIDHPRLLLDVPMHINIRSDSGFNSVKVQLSVALFLKDYGFLGIEYNALVSTFTTDFFDSRFKGSAWFICFIQDLLRFNFEMKEIEQGFREKILVIKLPTLAVVCDMLYNQGYRISNRDVAMMILALQNSIDNKNDILSEVIETILQTTRTEKINIQLYLLNMFNTIMFLTQK